MELLILLILVGAALWLAISLTARQRDAYWQDWLRSDAESLRVTVAVTVLPALIECRQREGGQVDQLARTCAHDAIEFAETLLNALDQTP